MDRRRSLFLAAVLIGLAVCVVSVQAACEKGCDCLTPAEAKKVGYEYCGGTRTSCGTSLLEPKYCYGKPVTPAPVPVTCGKGCSCLDAAKATAAGYQYCDEPHAVCGYDASKNPLYCFKKPETVTVTPVTCAKGCSCMDSAKAKAVGYTYCGGKQTVCDKDTGGNPLYCFEPPVTEEKTTVAPMTVVPVTCAKGCECLTKETASTKGYSYCSGKQTLCNYDQNKNPMYCFEKPVTPVSQTCASGCSCLAPDKAKAAGYGYCHGTQVLCGYDAAKNPLYCYGKTSAITVEKVSTTPTTVVVEKVKVTPTTQITKTVRGGFLSGIFDTFFGRRCTGGETLCNDECVDLRSSASNCGACDSPCASGEGCRGGECQELPGGGGIDCPPEWIPCGRECVNPRVDESHCGDCETACPDGYTCQGGTCCDPDGCPAPTAWCDGDCVDILRSDSNCGACGHSCLLEGDGPVCSDGVCRSEAYQGQEIPVVVEPVHEPRVSCAAGRTPCGGTCTDTSSDNTNCGGCGITCVEGESCCGGVCTNIISNPLNCGECGRGCPGGAVCYDGHCFTTGCPSTFTNCNRACVHTMSDAANCGSCGHACGEDQTCTSGTCTDCPAGRVGCDSGTQRICTDTAYSVLSCGECRHACPLDEVCRSGACVPCPEGQTACHFGSSGMCVNIQSDERNCGACGTRCESSEYCINGVCDVIGQGGSDCRSDWLSCGVDCVNPQTDSANCGGCAKVCPPGRECSGGRCVCAAGTTECARNPPGRLTPRKGWDTFCTDTQTDEDNCGECGNACRPDQVCQDGHCTCSDVTDLCGGVCVNIRSDPNNCGNCGHRCSDPANPDCCYGQCTNLRTDENNCGGCTLPGTVNKKCAEGFTCCNGICRNLNTDNQNCGVCGSRCVGGEGLCCNGICTRYELQPNVNQCEACGHECDLYTEYCCDGVCTNIFDDVKDCGMCGNDCPSGHICCPDGHCADLQSHPLDCGACGHECGPIHNYCRWGRCCLVLFGEWQVNCLGDAGAGIGVVEGS